jgi:hypothetical protein
MKQKKVYSSPSVSRIELDNSISLVMMTVMPPNPPPRGVGDGKGGDSPFASPFSDKPFN